MHRIDRLNDAIYFAIRWLVLVMIAVGAVNAVLRYTARQTGIVSGSNAMLDAQWYMFSLVFLLGAAYGLRHGVHVRVDVLYSRMSERARAWVDLVGTVVLALPFCILMLVTSWPAVRNSWGIREGSPDPGGLPRYPIKAVLLVGFTLLLLQAVAQIARKVRRLRRDDAVPAA